MLRISQICGTGSSDKPSFRHRRLAIRPFADIANNRLQLIEYDAKILRGEQHALAVVHILPQSRPGRNCAANESCALKPRYTGILQIPVDIDQNTWKICK